MLPPAAATAACRRRPPHPPQFVTCRPLRPDDRTALQLLHQRLFPVGGALGRRQAAPPVPHPPPCAANTPLNTPSLPTTQIDYDESFYHAAVNGLDGVVSWAALAPLPSLACLPIDADSLAPQLQRFSLKQQPQQQQQQLHSLRVGCGSEPAEVLAGFITGEQRGITVWLLVGCRICVTDASKQSPTHRAACLPAAARGFSALFADPHDRRLLGLAGEERDRERLLYVLTLGVAEVRLVGQHAYHVAACAPAMPAAGMLAHAPCTACPQSCPSLLPLPAQAYQRQGIARLLLDRVLAHAAQAGCHAVYLHVASFNQAAIAFYRRAGFRQLAHLPGFYTIK